MSPQSNQKYYQVNQATNRQSLEVIDAFFASLQHRAFRGDL